MKKILILLSALVFAPMSFGEDKAEEGTVVVCEPIKTEAKLMRCERFESRSLKSIDVWIATIP